MCLSESHETTCAFIYYSSNVTGAKSAEESCSGAVQSGKVAADARKAEEESSRAKRKEEERETRGAHTQRERERASERRRRRRTENERNGRNEKREIEIGKRRNEKRGNVRIEKNATEGSTTSTQREGTKMMMATGEKRGAIASGTAIAIAPLAIGPLIATMKAMTVDQKAKQGGPECRIGEIRARVSCINYLNLIFFRLQCP